tara:strand:- start:165 stop:320 length:156 start_codon:yes stop_codon:yes gene_type:complete
MNLDRVPDKTHKETAYVPTFFQQDHDENFQKVSSNYRETRYAASEAHPVHQ